MTHRESWEVEESRECPVVPHRSLAVELKNIRKHRRITEEEKLTEV